MKNYIKFNDIAKVAKINALYKMSQRLENAIREDDASRVRLILKHLCSSYRREVIHLISEHSVCYAVENASTAICAMLLKPANLEKKYAFIIKATSPLHKITNSSFGKAAINGYMPIVKLFLHELRQVSPLVRNVLLIDDCAILRSTVEHGKIRMFELLLKQMNHPLYKQDAISCIFKQKDCLQKVDQMLPLLLAYADVECIPKATVDLAQILKHNPDIAPRVDACWEALTKGGLYTCSQIVNQNAVLKLVCKKVQDKIVGLPVALFTKVCTFLGIPNFPTSFTVKFPNRPSFRFAEYLEECTEEKKTNANERC